MREKRRTTFDRVTTQAIPAVIFIVLASSAYAYLPAGAPVANPTATRQRAAYAFEDVTTVHSITSSRTPTWGSTWIDHDRDGWPELLVNRHKRPARFYRGSANGPRSVRQPALGRPAPGRNYYDRHACSWGEATGDGSPDLYCVAGAQKGVGTGRNQLLSVQAGRLVDQADAYGLTDPYGRGRTVNWIDFEGDGDLDLFVGNEVRPGRPNITFRNDRGHFTQVEVGLTEEISTINSSVADWDNDGDADLMLLGHGEKGSVVYENVDGYFRSSWIPIVSGEPWISAAWADFDDDGWIDLHLMSRWRSVLLKNNSGTLVKFQEMGLSTGRMSAWLDVENDGDLDIFVVQGEARGKTRSRNREDFLLLQSGGRFHVEKVGSLRGPRDGSGDAVSVADYDRDGRMDLLVTNGYLEQKGRVQLLRNTSRAKRWLGLSLIGSRWNPLGIGARVEVRAKNGVARFFHVTDGFNFKAQSEAGYLHVGMGDQLSGRMRVTWPDGTADCVTGLSGLVTTLRKGSSPCRPGVTPTD